MFEHELANTRQGLLHGILMIKSEQTRFYYTKDNHVCMEYYVRINTHFEQNSNANADVDREFHERESSLASLYKLQREDPNGSRGRDKRANAATRP